MGTTFRNRDKSIGNEKLSNLSRTFMQFRFMFCFNIKNYQIHHTSSSKLDSFLFYYQKL